ncbi:MAG TPA: glycosyltransferase [Desulfobacteraceae bacterium]|nr:glycosyltransferase [Desulfobacteraceae bacterium]HPJ67676.1 glycosyltransferase [Desulfobacteraceae bacterium]HPQ27808.1 glycosyltransferase [Desulfobacteraceae bacterium]
MKKKIAYIVTPVEFGGAERVSLNFLKNVDRNKFQIYPIIFFRPWEADSIFLKELKKEDFSVYKIPVSVRASLEERDRFWLVRCFKMIFLTLLKGRFDLIHTHGYFADIIAIPVAKLLGIPVISTCHGFIEDGRKLKRSNRIDRMILKFSNRVIAVSQGIKQELLKSGLREPRIDVVLNAVQTEMDNEILKQDRYTRRRALDVSESDFVLGYIGRLSKEKGVSYLLDAAEILFQQGIPIKVLIIGDGPAKKDSELIVRQKGLENKVFFAGFQTYVKAWIPAMDVFLLPSLTEGTPMALLEAMACRIPIVASSVGGVPQIIESGKDGILVAPGNPEELAAGVMALYNNNSQREQFVEAARKKIISNFNIKKWTKTIESKYAEIAG